MTSKITSDIYQGDQTDHFKYALLESFQDISPKDIIFWKLGHLKNAAITPKEYEERIKRFFHGLCELEVITSPQTTEYFIKKSAGKKVIFINPPVGLSGVKSKTYLGTKSDKRSVEYIHSKTFNDLLQSLQEDQALFYYQYVRAMELKEIKNICKELAGMFNTNKIVESIVFPNCVFIFLTPKGLSSLLKKDFYERLETSKRIISAN